MRKGNFEFIIISSPEREKVSCEIYYKEKIMGELSQEKDVLELEIFSKENDKWWTFSLIEFQEALIFAENYLLGKGYSHLPS